MKKIRICEACGKTSKETRVSKSKKHNMILCMRHKRQKDVYGQFSVRTNRDPNEIIMHDNYAEIVLYNMQSQEIGRAIIDINDIENVKAYKWCIGNHGYSVTTIGKEIICLHNFIMGGNPDIGFEYDHKNRNRLDCRKDNLRIVTRSQNNMNTGLRSNNISGHKGISWHKASNKWRVQIAINKKIKHIGIFTNKIDAIRRRLEAELEIFGEFMNEESKMLANELRIRL